MSPRKPIYCIHKTQLPQLVRCFAIFPPAKCNSIGIKRFLATISVARRAAAESCFPAMWVRRRAGWALPRFLCTGAILFHCYISCRNACAAARSCTQLAISTSNTDNATRGLTYYYKDITSLLCMTEVYRICIIPSVKLYYKDITLSFYYIIILSIILL